MASSMRTPFIQRDDVWQYLEWLNPAFCTPAEACLAGVMERGWVLEEVEGLGENGAPIVWEQLPNAGNFKWGGQGMAACSAMPPGLGT